MSKEQDVRQKIRELVKELYMLKHVTDDFHPGTSRISYAGRVFDEKEIQALVDSALDFWLTFGPQGQEFERKLAKYIGVRFASMVNSGSSANLLAFGALHSPFLKERKIPKGSEVITVAAGFPTTVNPILQYRCVPVFVDVTQDTMNIDASLLEEARSEKTKAVMIAHTLGNPFDVDRVVAFCRKYNFFLIEDNCDALGSEYNGRKTGSFGHLSTYSFFPAHHITVGEGGAVLTDDAVLNRAINSLRDWGKDCWCESGKDNTCGKRFSAQYGDLPYGYDHKYVFSEIGFNLKPLDLQAAIGSVQLDKLPSFVKARQKNYQTFRDAFKQYEDCFIFSKETQGANSSWFGFPMTVRNGAQFKRDDIVHFLEEHNIQTRMLFAGNLTRQPLFCDLKKGSDYRVVGELKNTDKIMNDTFWIGVYPGLTDEKTGYIVDTFKKFFSMKQNRVSVR